MPPEDQTTSSSTWRLLPRVALGLLLASTLLFLPWPQAYLFVARDLSPLRWYFAGFAAAMTLLSLVVRSRSLRAAAFLLAALHFLVTLHLSMKLWWAYRLFAVAPAVCRDVLTAEPTRGAETIALEHAGVPASAGGYMNIRCGQDGAALLWTDGSEAWTGIDPDGELQMLP